MPMRKLYVNSEHVEAGAWASDTHEGDPGFVDEVTLSYSKEENPVDGCDFEFTIQFHEWTGSGGKGAIKLKIWSDAFIALDSCPEVFDLLKEKYYNRHSGQKTIQDFRDLCDDLEKRGWTRVHPEKVEPKRCKECNRVFKSEECVR